MEKLKQYKYIIFILLLVLGFVFYWFQLRPTQIRKECNRISFLESNIIDRSREDEFVPGSIAFKFASPDERYKICLRSKGL